MLKALLKFEILTTLAFQNMKFGKNQEIRVTLKIWLKFQIFDHPGPVKHEIQ